MNYILVPNAIVLILLGLYTWRQNPGRLSLLYLVTNISVAIWALCFLVLHEFQYAVPINQVSRLQLVSALVFTNGFYYTSLLYPNVGNAPGKFLTGLNSLAGLMFVVLIIATDFVSRAMLEDGVVVFVDGVGYLLYSLYLALLSSLTILNLIVSYRRYPEYRVRVGYMLVGIGLFILMAIIFDVVLVLLGNYELLAVGHLASAFPSLFFAYAITKHDLMDIKLVVQRSTAKLIVVTLVVTSLVLAFELSLVSRPGSLLLICVVGVAWAFIAGPLEILLITTAKRKFVRNWYDAEEILNRLAGNLELEKNRRDIFRKVVEEIDSTFELECAHSIVAVRAADDRLLGYELIGDMERQVMEGIQVNSTFIDECRARTAPVELVAFSDESRRWLAELGHTRAEKSLVIPFFSPEIMEGVIVLGERSNQDAFNRKDRQFLTRLVSYVSAILYRLTPFEKLEKLYFENQRRLHEAEIQLVRRETTRAIAHATRQAHHEIRTPLNIIRLGARRIKDMESAEKYKEIIETQIERAMEIVDETLAITDAESSDEERFLSVDVNQIVVRCLRLLPESVHAHVLKLQDDLPSVRGIPSELQVLFSNLVKNALEAMPERGVVSVQTYQDRTEVVVTITDTGNGIAPHLREKIWEPYFSGKVTAGGNLTAGRGWGLTICNRIVTEHKGTIQFTSVEGEGTTFTVRLPIELASRD